MVRRRRAQTSGPGAFGRGAPPAAPRLVHEDRDYRTDPGSRRSAKGQDESSPGGWYRHAPSRGVRRRREAAAIRRRSGTGHAAVLRPAQGRPRATTNGHPAGVSGSARRTLSMDGNRRRASTVAIKTTDRRWRRPADPERDTGFFSDKGANGPGGPRSRILHLRWCCVLAHASMSRKFWSQNALRASRVTKILNHHQSIGIIAQQ